MDRGGTAKEVLARLEPVAERTAVFVAIDRDRVARPMIDPATDIPVAVPADEHGESRALAPQRLPTTSPLAEVILDHPIWIRTEGGTLYPAPYDWHSGLNWGCGWTGRAPSPRSSTNCSSTSLRRPPVPHIRRLPV